MKNLKKKNLIKKLNKQNQLITKGIEVGHIFYFGDKYSKPFSIVLLIVKMEKKML